MQEQQAHSSGEIAVRLKSVVDYVHDCERRVHMGEIVSLQGLDKNVTEICEAVATLPQDQARGFEEQMMTLIGKLETLAATMKQQHQSMIDGGGR